jgi:hypothetical protein
MEGIRVKERPWNGEYAMVRDSTWRETKPFIMMSPLICHPARSFFEEQIDRHLSGVEEAVYRQSEEALSSSCGRLHGCAGG